MTTPEQHPETAYQTGALPPYTVTHIDPDHLGIPGPERWFVMGTVDGDPRDQQGPVAVCEWEPSAHTIARLLNATAGGRLDQGQPPTTDPDRPPPTIDGITLTADELDALTAWARASSRGGFRVWLEHDTVVEAATRIVAARLQGGQR